MKLVLSSFNTTPLQDVEIVKLVGKAARDIRVAIIENAYDVYHDEAGMIEGRKDIAQKGYDCEVVDLKQFKGQVAALRDKLSSKDMFIFYGGNPYYLRWVMKACGADTVIPELVRRGVVYNGASAGAVVSGPTLKYFDKLDDPNEAGEIIWEGLKLTDFVLVPHIDNAEFGEELRKAGEQLRADGYETVEIQDTQVVIVDGDARRII
jgi:peptidase E